jgi:hypothetical protein
MYSWSRLWWALCTKWHSQNNNVLLRVESLVEHNETAYIWSWWKLAAFPEWFGQLLSLPLSEGILLVTCPWRL